MSTKVASYTKSEIVAVDVKVLKTVIVAIEKEWREYNIHIETNLTRSTYVFSIRVKIWSKFT